MLFSFGGASGSGPRAGLINVDGVLYGTSGGGADYNGTVFQITTSGIETIIHNFAVRGDGADPSADLTNVNGVLYGTTIAGGAHGKGTVFKITKSGAETVLYSFKGGSDGENPVAGLTELNGVLYGTTQGGGTGDCFVLGGGGCGTVFKVTQSGAESVLYSFLGGNDGAYPLAGLTNVNGVLYGTTEYGGYVCAGRGCGTIFEIAITGAESVIYNFAGGSDGARPFAGLTNVNGTLYGTTYGGGSDGCSGQGCGTVYKMSTSGMESVLYSFAGGNDGVNPYAKLTYINGVFYGTTEGAGAKNNGTVYKVTPSGVESVLYSFAGGNDGSLPFADVTDIKGVLYGTTFQGGVHRRGTVFSVPL